MDAFPWKSRLRVVHEGSPGGFPRGILWKESDGGTRLEGSSAVVNKRESYGEGRVDCALRRGPLEGSSGRGPLVVPWGALEVFA
jgi:hypothetical protein